MIWGFVTSVGLIQIASRDLSDIYEFFVTMAQKPITSGFSQEMAEYASDTQSVAFMEVLRGVKRADRTKPATRRRTHLRQGTSKKTNFGFLFTCRQMYTELLHLLYENNIFAFSDYLSLEDFSGRIRQDCLAGITSIQINQNYISGLMNPSFRSGLPTLCLRYRGLHTLHIPRRWLHQDWIQIVNEQVIIHGDSGMYHSTELARLVWAGKLEDMVGVELLCN